MARRLNSKFPRAPRACSPRTYSPSKEKTGSGLIGPNPTSTGFREMHAALFPCPRHLPDRFQHAAAALPAFAQDRFVALLHLHQRDAKTERVTDIAADVRSQHGK